MTNTPFMQLYVGDYLADTQHLTTEQHGAYLLLLMTMWRHGAKLPNDPKKLSRIAGVSPRRWHMIWPDLEPLFVVDDTEITHNRLKREYKKVTSISEKRSASGKRGGKAKALKNKDSHLASASDLPKHSQISESEKINSPTERVDSSKPIRFDPRDKFASGDFIFDESRWFSENEIAFLEDKHPKIDVRSKLADTRFQNWAFTADSNNPLLPARRWFEKQARVADAEKSLVDNYAETRDMTFNNPSHLVDILNKGKRK